MTAAAGVTSEQALRRLREGNRRFVSGEGGRDLHGEHVRRMALQRDQAPFAVVLGCSDSRVPLEMIFDQGLGDLFVVRVAGNVAAPTQVGSIEYAVDHFGASLVVVLGHADCGAIDAAFDFRDGEAGASPHLENLLRRIRPVVNAVRNGHGSLDPAGQRAFCERENARRTAAALMEESAMLRGRVADGRLRIVAARYALRSGEVEFLDA